ncbi:hypothetical protein LDENG_00165190 [Lucifuga dentata]|nr:hypothetical protein LDENG_00165190 [Lucifuga dentata]
MVVQARRWRAAEFWTTNRTESLSAVVTVVVCSRCGTDLDVLVCEVNAIISNVNLVATSLQHVTAGSADNNSDNEQHCWEKSGIISSVLLKT